MINKITEVENNLTGREKQQREVNNGLIHHGKGLVG